MKRRAKLPRARTTWMATLLLAGASAPWSGASWALSAKLLPEQALRARVIHNEARADHWFTHGGARVALGEVGLERLATQGIAAAVPGLYTLDNHARYTLSRSELTLDYGLTDDLTLGLWLPLIHHDTEQRTTLSQGPGWASLPAAQQGGISNAVATLDGGDASRSDVGDLFLGFKQRLIGTNDAPFRLSLGGGVTAPTGHVADPLDPRDASTGDGQWDLSLWSWTDVQLSERLLLNLHTRHHYGLSGERDTPDPLAPSRITEMEFQPAVKHHLQLEAQYTLPFAGWDLLPGLLLIHDRQDEERRQTFDPSRGGFVGDPVDTTGTAWRRSMIQPSLGLSLFKSGLPLRLFLRYGHTFDGRNTAQLDTIELRVEFYLGGKRP